MGINKHLQGLGRIPALVKKEGRRKYEREVNRIGDPRTLVCNLGNRTAPFRGQKNVFLRYVTADLCHMKMLLRRTRQVGHLDGGARHSGSDDIVERDLGMTGLGGRREEECMRFGGSSGGRAQ